MLISVKKFTGCFWKNLICLIEANLAFWLFCLPVVTIPAALTGMYGFCADAVMNRTGGVFRAFTGAVRKRFGRSLVTGLVYAALFFSVVTAVRLYSGLWQISRLAIIPEGIALSVGFVAYAMLPYSFVMLAKTELRVKDILKNSFLLLFLEPKAAVSSFLLRSFWLLILVSFFMRIYALILVAGIAIPVYSGAYFGTYGLLKRGIDGSKVTDSDKTQGGKLDGIQE